ncbi:hypothetical protein HN873_007960, partial [Arachis hypogaea]
CFLSLSFDEDLGMSEKKDDDPKFRNKKNKKRINMEASNQFQIMTKSEVEANYKVALFALDGMKRRQMQSETLSAVFDTEILDLDCEPLRAFTLCSTARCHHRQSQSRGAWATRRGNEAGGSLTHFYQNLQEADGIILFCGNLGIDLPSEKNEGDVWASTLLCFVDYPLEDSRTIGRYNVIGTIAFTFFILDETDTTWLVGGNKVPKERHTVKMKLKVAQNGRILK